MSKPGHTPRRFVSKPGHTPRRFVSKPGHTPRRFVSKPGHTPRRFVSKPGHTPGFARSRSHKPSARSTNGTNGGNFWPPSGPRIEARLGGGPEVPVVSYGVLRNRPAYPEHSYRQRLTTWKKNGRRAPQRAVAQQTVLTTGLSERGRVQTLRSPPRTEHFAGGPLGPIRQNVE